LAGESFARPTFHWLGVFPSARAFQPVKSLPLNGRLVSPGNRQVAPSPTATMTRNTLVFINGSASMLPLVLKLARAAKA